MNATEKYLFEIRMNFLADDVPLSDAALDSMLKTTGPTSDPAKRNPNPLTAAGLVELLGAIIKRSNRRLEAAAEVFGLDIERLHRTAEAEEKNGDVDRVTANMIALARELSRRGPTAKPLTKWILTNAEVLQRNMTEKGRERMIAETVEYFEGGNTAGKSNPEYAKAIRQYFDAEREHLDAETKLIASCILMGWDYEAVAEKAAVLEFDAGMSRTTAAMRAVWYAFCDRHSQFSETMAAVFFDLTAAALGHEQANGWRRSETISWLMERLHGSGEDASPLTLPQSRVAV